MAREEKAESRDASEETEGERESVGVGYSCYIIHPAFVGDCGRGGGCGLTYALIRRFRSISDNGIGLSLSLSLSLSLHTILRRSVILYTSLPSRLEIHGHRHGRIDRHVCHSEKRKAKQGS